MDDSAPEPKRARMDDSIHLLQTGIKRLVNIVAGVQTFSKEIFCADPIVPRTLRVLVGHPALKTMRPSEWQHYAPLIPPRVLPHVARGLPIETLVSICDAETEECPSSLKDVLYSEAARRGRTDIIFSANASSQLSLEDVFRSKSEKLIASRNIDPKNILDVLVETLHAGNLEQFHRFLPQMMDRVEEYTDYHCTALRKAAIVGGDIECLRAVPDRASFEDEDVAHIIRYGTVEMLRYASEELDFCCHNTDDDMRHVICACNRDDPEMLEAYFAATGFEVRLSQLKDAVDVGLCRCLSLLLSKYRCTPREVDTLWKRAGSVRCAMALWNITSTTLPSKVTAMNANDVWDLLMWIPFPNEVVSRGAFVLAMLDKAEGDYEFDRIRSIVRLYTTY